MNDIDTQINRDLSTLAGETRRGLGDFTEVAALIDGCRSAYRDNRPGAEARRGALLERRHLELALMPLSLERAFVHRVSRAAAGGVAALCALAIVVGLSEPALVEVADMMVPGRITFSLVSLAAAVVILFGYIAAGWVAERAFERRVREALATSGDPHRDLDALARGPLDHARALVRRADGWAVALPLLAVATLAPLLAFLSMASLSFTRRPIYDLWELSRVAVGTGDLLYLTIGMAAGAVVAVALGRACRAEHLSLEKPRALALLEHPIVVVVAVVAALALVAVLGQTFDALHAGHSIPGFARAVLAAGGTLVVVAPAAWGLLWYRRREQRMV